ncbi:hypothetical protein E3N88_22545 [Mikania micrantha]|uniref:Cytochrome P450 n=1 Tax=Mikania micrantha TaxID=192012 RepID=A0A5N6NB07_9ASTR|nr:hypothetical protein E3N88_22545 [Mikania micrantha]
MEIPYSYLVLLLPVLYLLTKLTATKPKPPNLPPQPWKLPFIGHLHHLSGSLPHQALANLAQKLGPIIHLQLGEIKAVVISSPDLAKQIMKTDDLSFATRPKLLCAEIVGYNYIDIAFAPYGDYWRQMRKLSILELLSAKRVESFESVRDEESWNVVEATMKESPRPVNVTEKIFTMMNVISFRVSVGSRCKNQAKLLELIEQILSAAGGFDVADLYPSFKLLHLVSGLRKKLMKIHHDVDEMFEGIISDHLDRRAAGETDHGDLLDVMLRLKDEGGLQFPITNDNIKAILLETLRLHPPLPLLLPRECRNTCEVDGYDIPVNTKVIINCWKIGRDPKCWTDPESFIPERFSESSIDYKGTSFELIPFGAGRRMCPGMTLGMANVELPLARLLYHFNWELPSGVKVEDLDRTETFGVSLKRRDSLVLVPSVYNID